MSIYVHKNEPYKLENGRLWYNPDDGETRIYNDGIWEIVQTKSADYLRGVDEERERIIKLLEDPHSMLGSNIAHWQFGCDNEAKLQAFEIIRGENK